MAVRIQLHPETRTAYATFKSLGRVKIAMIGSGKSGWADLNVGECSCVMMRGFANTRDDMTDEEFFDTCLIPQWHGFIKIGDVERRVSVDQETWELTFHDR